MENEITTPEQEKYYSISINYRADTVRIYKKVLSALGNPKYLQFLINPEAKILYMRGAGTSGVNCLEVPSDEFLKRNCCVLHGKSFIKKLSNLAGWSLKTRYVVKGTLETSHNTIVFDLSEAVPGTSKDSD